jgi:3-phosphoshikimate 1-carboxyvinyltransferase
MQAKRIIANITNHDATIVLPASKSICNRALILQSFIYKEFPEHSIQLLNLSTADDSLLMIDALSLNNERINLKNAGTCMRFLIAYFAALNGVEKILDGDERMRNRPISALVDALRELGADIEYLGKIGFPPLKIKGKKLKSNKTISVDGNESSQFLSAILLIAPFIENGCSFKWDKNIGSSSYNLMTISVMSSFGFDVKLIDDIIQVKEIQSNSDLKNVFQIESDWSSAAFFYEALAIKQTGKIKFENLSLNSIQGDAELANLMQNFGINSQQIGADILIESNQIKPKENIEFDCKQFPDLVPALVCAAVSRNLTTKFSGLSKLNFKESKRLDDLVFHFKKLKPNLESNEDEILLFESEEKFPDFVFNVNRDHRMVMAYAMLAFQYKEVYLNETDWVEKSFPDFWNQAEKIGLKLEVIQ